jgi:hypothetical protein
MEVNWVKTEIVRGTRGDNVGILHGNSMTLTKMNLIVINSSWQLMDHTVLIINQTALLRMPYIAPSSLREIVVVHVSCPVSAGACLD